jgi:hypothetical protein
MSPTRRDRSKPAGVAGLAAAVPVDAQITRPVPLIDSVHVVWCSSLAIEQHSGEHLVNEMELTISSDGVLFTIADGAPLSERHTMGSADPAVMSFLSEVVRAMREMREMQYTKRHPDRQLTEDQWRQCAAKQLAGERLSDMVPG